MHYLLIIARAHHETPTKEENLNSHDKSKGWQYEIGRICMNKSAFETQAFLPGFVNNTGRRMTHGINARVK
jgi:hypothetical protein